MQITDFNADISGTSLQGYVEATFSELVEALNFPSYQSCDVTEKVNNEWAIAVDVGGKKIVVTVYDWKEGDGGEAARGGKKMYWHVGGRDQRSLVVLEAILDRSVKSAY